MAGELADKEPRPGWFQWALDYPMTSDFVKTPATHNVAIHYLQWMPPKAKRQRGNDSDDDVLPPSVIFLHGTAAHAHWYHHIAPFFADDGYEVLAVSFSSHGSSEMMSPDVKSGRHTWAAEVVEVANHLNLFDPRRRSLPLIVGHSLGSFVATEICLKVGEAMMAGLVILDGGVPHPMWWEAKGQKKKPDDRWPGVSPPSTRRQYNIHEHTPARRLLLSPPQPGVPPHVLEHIANTGARMTDADSWEWKVHPSYYARSGFQQMVNEVGTPGNIRSLNMRVAVVFGEHSLVVGHHTRVYMRDVLGENIPVITIPAAGHHCFLDQPLAVVSSLRSIFAEWNRSATSNGTGAMLPRLSARATLGTNEGGGFDGREDLMLERVTEELKHWVGKSKLAKGTNVAKAKAKGRKTPPPSKL
jgi:pimeloyl-ACP methyl ester carboxylesterase